MLNNSSPWELDNSSCSVFSSSCFRPMNTAAQGKLVPILILSSLIRIYPHTLLSITPPPQILHLSIPIPILTILLLSPLFLLHYLLLVRTFKVPMRPQSTILARRFLGRCRIIDIRTNKLWMYVLALKAW